MGVPGFYRELIKKYKDIVKKKLEKKNDALYIDANCLFHPECFKVLEYYPNITNQKKLFKLMVKRIIKKIDYLIELCDPSIVYLAVDGVAPLAKINQQRIRRFGYSNNYKAKIYQKYGIEINSSWSNIVITPGTQFMYDLHNHILNYYKKKEKTYKMIYDSYMTEGEGEHKILQHIKNTYSKNKHNKNIIIYGLDADLIFLSMSSSIDKIFLLREADQFNMISKEKNEDENDEMIYADIDLTKYYINEEFNKLVNNGFTYNFINDYIFICYFLGNDFLPHLPSIDIKINGLDIIKEVYFECFDILNTNLIHFENKTVKINNEFLILFIKNLGSKERNFFKKDLKYHMLKHDRKTCYDSEPHKIELWNIENLKNIKIYDNIKLHQYGYKNRYYKHYFKTEEYSKETINEICHNYLEGLLWVSRYYFDKCDSWRYQYKYNHAPFLSDLYFYINEKNINKDFEYPKEKPLKIYEQLVSVIPHKYNHILPYNLRFISSSCKSNVIDMFPISYDIDMINKTQLYKCIPILPYLDINRIINIVSNIKLSKKDYEKSTIKKPFIIK